MAAEDIKEKYSEEKAEYNAPQLSQSPGIILEPNYGFLSELKGVWHNKNDEKLGVNVILLPSVNSLPTATAGTGDNSFTKIQFKYYETLTFTLNNLARNRGGISQQFNAVVEYSQIVKGTQNDKLPITIQHIENGMYLYLDNISLEDPTSGKNIYKPEFNYCRSGTVPHGNSLMLFGKELDVINCAPDFNDKIILPYLSTSPFPVNILGYDDPSPGDLSPLEGLMDGIKNKKIIETRTLFLSSENKGNISNTQFINKFVDTSKMDVFLWLETVDNGDGTTYKQLQYLQRMLLKFEKDPKTHLTINWPHITVNTLTLK